MAQPRHLPKAPIVEAIIDLRVRTAADFDSQVFASLLEELGDEYKGPQNLTRFEFNIEQALRTGRRAAADRFPLWRRPDCS